MKLPFHFHWLVTLTAKCGFDYHLGQIIIGSLFALNLLVLYKLHGMRHIKLLCILIFYCIV